VPGLPAPSSNLFQRIIRNPHADSPKARERECSEMLAAVLINAPSLRRHIFQCLAHLSGLNADLIDDLDFNIRTEHFAGAKRIDLCIEGRRSSDSDDPPVILWTIEVKVGSSFHASPMQRFDEDGAPVEDEELPELGEKLINQLKNYDEWLGVQKSTHRGGFVLALRNLSKKLPPLNLKQKWMCLSWTSLGLVVKTAIEKQELPPQETLLAKHLLGFISKNLWRNQEMPKPKLDFNDVALVRAFSKIGKDCEAKINALMDSMLPLFKEVGIVGNVNVYKCLYKALACSKLELFFVPKHDNGGEPKLCLAIGSDESDGDYMGVFLQMSPNHPKLDHARTALGPAISRMPDRKPSWEKWESGSDSWNLMTLSLPLTTLLVAEDQEKEARSFFRSGLIDLKESGALDAIVKVFDGSSRKASPK